MRLQHPDRAQTSGFVTAIAEMYQATGSESAARAVARAAGITLASARACGACDYDLRALRRAGIR